MLDDKNALDPFWIVGVGEERLWPSKAEPYVENLPQRRESQRNPTKRASTPLSHPSCLRSA